LAARDILVASREGYCYQFRLDASTTQTQLLSPGNLPKCPRDAINEAVYDPVGRNLYYTTSSSYGLYRLEVSERRRTSEKILDISGDPGRRLLYDSSQRRVIAHCTEGAYDKTRDEYIITKHWFAYLSEDGSWLPMDTKAALNFVHVNVRAEWVPKGSLRGKDLLVKCPTLPSEVQNFGEDEDWRLIGCSDKLTLYALQRSGKLKIGEPRINQHYLILDEKSNSQKVLVLPNTGSGNVFGEFIVIMETTRKAGYPSQGKKDQTGDWYLYFSGAKQIHKRKLPLEFRLQTADEAKDLLYFTADKVLYEVPVTVDGWGEPRKLAVLPVEPDWTFVMPSTP
jgi:hypothetical protein